MKQVAALHDVDTNYWSTGSNIRNDEQVKVEHLDSQKKGGKKRGEKVLDKIFMSNEKSLKQEEGKGAMRGNDVADLKEIMPVLQRY